MADIDLALLTPSAPQANDVDVVRRGASAPFSPALVPNVRQEVIDARGNRLSLNDRISLISDISGPNLAPPVVGRYYDNGFTPSSLTGTISLGANRFTTVPYVTPHRWRIDRLGFNVINAATEGLFRCFIYAADPSNLLTTDQLFAGALELDISTPGFKEHILDFVFEPDTVYWLGMNGNFTGTPTVRSIPVGSGKGFGPVSAADTAYRTGFSKTSILSTNPLPALAPVVEADLVALGNQLPLFRMRAAAL